jgi:gas vesicle protein
MNKSQKVKKGGLSKGKMLAVGAGLAALGAGAYYFLGPNGKKNRQKTSVLLKKVQKEVKSKVSKVKNAAKPVYDKAVDAVASNYAKQHKAHEPEIKALANKLKSEWNKVTTKAKKKTATKKKKA